MLLKFSSPDMLNTSLIDVATSERAYDIVTVPLPRTDSANQDTHSVLPSGSSPVASSSKSQTPNKPSSDSDDRTNGERRETIITNATGNVVAKIIWKGRRPDITILDEKVGALTDLFGSSTVRFMPKVLAIPTRFDTEYIWTATPDSLTLFDYDTEKVKGSFHQNVIRLPTRSKASKPNPSSPSSKSTNLLTSKSSTSSFSTTSTEDRDHDAQTHKPTFIATHLPGVGSNYLEFSSHPLAHDIEIILSFLMMEILRRGRFSLTPYTFEKPKVWKEARDLIMRRLRRNTV